MFALLCFVLAVLASPFKSRIRLEAENAALRHQLIVLRRKSGPESLVHTRSLVDFITTTSGFRFSVHTPLGPRLAFRSTSMATLLVGRATSISTDRAKRAFCTLRAN